MLNQNDPLFSADKFFKDTRKRIEAIEDLYKRLNNGVGPKRAEESKSAMTMEEMLQNSRNNVEKLKQLSRRLNNNS
jgi:hypothetical protein